MKQDDKVQPLPKLLPDLQISFYRRLQEFQNSYLYEALNATVQAANITKIDRELSKLVKPKTLSTIASFGLRGEIFFPVPYILIARPSLLGYYRLLYGISQKEFYRHPRMASFKCMEERNEIPENLMQRIPALCTCLINTADIMVNSIDEINLRTVRDLQLLTLGAQFRGGQNTKLGKDATAEVFKIIENICRKNIIELDTRHLKISNAAGRDVMVTFSSDPDIAIIEMMESINRPLVSIEIKGGTDKSNIHNRIGEAEKSHQKAKDRNFYEFWTILGAKVNLNMAQRESPTTSIFFHLSDLRDTESNQYKIFKQHLQSVIGLKTR